MPLTPPYELIVDMLNEGAIVPFLGAGVNYGHRVPGDALWMRSGSPFLRRDDILSPSQLCLQLKSAHPVSEHLRLVLPERVTYLLNTCNDKDPSEETISAIISGLNSVIRPRYGSDEKLLQQLRLGQIISETLLKRLANRDVLREPSQDLIDHVNTELWSFLKTLHFYCPQRFKDVDLSPHTRKLSESQPTDEQTCWLNRWLLEDTYVGSIRHATHAKCEFLPMGGELSRGLASYVSFPYKYEYELFDLAKVASYFTVQGQRDRLNRYLHEVFDFDYSPCSIHRYLAEVSASIAEDTPMVIVTTNYDDLLERAFEDVEQERVTNGQPIRPYDVIIHRPQDSERKEYVHFIEHGKREAKAYPSMSVPIELIGRTIIYKMHGTVVREQIDDSIPRERGHEKQDRKKGNQKIQSKDYYVITEEDYVDFLSNMSAVPPALLDHFAFSHFLFLGYGLGDWNLRVLLEHLNSKFDLGQKVNEAQSYAVQRNPPDADHELWEKRGVKIFDIDIDEFVVELRRAAPLSMS